MPLDISTLTVRANLKGKKAKKTDRETPDDAQAEVLKKVSAMLADLVPMVRDDIHDRLNR
jgi:hypothetical protein